MTNKHDNIPAAPRRYYSFQDAAVGFCFGMVVNICGIHLTLPHEHALSPWFLDGISNNFPGSLTVHLIFVQLFAALAVAMAMSASRSYRTAHPGPIDIFPPKPEPFQRFALGMLPVVSVMVAALCWGFLMGGESPMWPGFFGKMFPSGAIPIASWSVWIVAFYASAVTASVLSAYQIQPSPEQPEDQS